MEISPSQLLTALASSPQTRSLDNLESGQVITATVSRLISPELAEIRIGQSVVQAKLTEVLQEGQQLRLQVQRSGDTTQLRVIEQAVTEVDTLTNALRTAIPKQTALAPVLSRLIQLVSNTPEKTTDLSNESRTLIKNLLDSLPTRQSVRQPANIQQSIRQSGILLEHTLQSTNQGNVDIASGLKSDLKAQLLRIAASLKQAAAVSTQTSQQTSAQPGRTTVSSTTPAPAGTQTTTNTTNPQTAVPTDTSQNASTRAAQQTAESASPTGRQAAESGNAPANSLTSRAATSQQPLPDTQLKDTARAAPVNPLPPSGISESETDTSRAQQILRAHYTPGTQHSSNPATQRPELLNTLLHSKNLADDIDAAIARITMHQLNTIHADESNRPALILELPIQNQEKVDSFQLRIEEEDHNSETPAHERLWRVSLDFNLENLGRCYAIITVRNEHVTTDLWSENENTTRLFSQHSGLLNAALAGAGLSVTRVQCHTGNPPSATITTHKSLLNIKV